MGWRLRDIGRRLSWWDVRVVIGQHRQDPSSALYRATAPDWRWGLAEQIAAMIHNTLSSTSQIRIPGQETDDDTPPPPPVRVPEKTASEIRAEIAAAWA